MDTMEIYKKNFTPPDWALKTIKGGRLSGMSDINPQWRVEALTETFGLCGIGWKYVIINKWLETYDKEVSAFVELNLFIKNGNEWSDPIPAIGGSSFVAMEKNGAYMSDECFKMATTDALSVCCKMLGIGGAIYLGSKYSEKIKIDEEEKQKELEAIKKQKELETAISEMLNCTHVEEVKQVWEKHKAKHGVNKEFMETKDTMKKQLS